MTQLNINRTLYFCCKASPTGPSRGRATLDDDGGLERTTILVHFCSFIGSFSVQSSYSFREVTSLSPFVHLMRLLWQLSSSPHGLCLDFPRGLSFILDFTAVGRNPIMQFLDVNDSIQWCFSLKLVKNILRQSLICLDFSSGVTTLDGNVVVLCGLLSSWVLIWSRPSPRPCSASYSFSSSSSKSFSFSSSFFSSIGALAQSSFFCSSVTTSLQQSKTVRTKTSSQVKLMPWFNFWSLKWLWTFPFFGARTRVSALLAMAIFFVVNWPWPENCW